MDRTPDVALLETTERVLLEAVNGVAKPNLSPAAREYYELRAQAALFNYEFTRQIVCLWELPPQGFAEGVALKEIIHVMFEYDRALSRRLLRRIVQLAQSRQVPVTFDVIKAEQKRQHEQLKTLRKWENIRDQTTGHYGSDIAEQIRLIATIDGREVTRVAIGFLGFTLEIMKLLARIGQEGVGPAAGEVGAAPRSQQGDDRSTDSGG